MTTGSNRRKILITGASNGIGKGAALALGPELETGSDLILLCRSAAASAAVLQLLRELAPQCKVSLLVCDLAQLAAVRNAIATIRSAHGHLDAVFINAGIGYAPQRNETEDNLDAHFQVNYLAQFMLTLNLLPLLEKSSVAGRVVFNATQYGQIFWHDMQLKKGWSYEKAIFQSMAAKRMLVHFLHHLYRKIPQSKLSFVSYQVRKTVWSNQLNIIPKPMKIMASLLKLFGGFISIEDSGRDMLPLFLESQEDSLKRSGDLITSKKNGFPKIKESTEVLDLIAQEKLWQASLELCKDAETTRIAADLSARAGGR